MGKDSFILYTEQKEIFDLLSDEEAGKLIKCLFHYVETGELIEVDNKIKLAMLPIKHTLDRNLKKWEETKEKRSKAGKIGMQSRWGNKKEKDITSVISVIKNNNTTITEDNTDITKITDNVNVNVHDNVNVNVINNNKKIKKCYFDNEEINKLFLDYLDLRKSMKIKNTDRAVALLVNKLNKYPDDIKKSMLEESIEKSWRSVYPPKNFKPKEELPTWFNKDNELEVVTEEQQKEMEDLFSKWKE